MLSSGVEVEEPTVPPSPARCFSRTFLASDARIYPVAAMGSTSLDTLPRPLPLGVCRGEGEGSLCHTCARVDDWFPGARRSARRHPTRLAPSSLCLVTGTPALALLL